MKKLATLLFIISFSWVYGQQDVQFTQFMHNRMFYNPGVTGSGDAICLVGVHRSQWVGFDNAPVSQNLSASIPLKILHGGLGVQLHQDQIGYFQDITAGLSYAYQHELPSGAQLGIGVQIDFRNKSVQSGGTWIYPDGNAGANDPNIPMLGASSLAIDGNFGIYYNSPEIWAGVSTARMLEAEAELASISAGSVTAYKHKRSYLIMGGYNYALKNSNVVLTPSIMVKTDLSATTFDLHLGALYNNKIWGGVQYRLDDALGLMAGYYITDDFKITYSYDLTLSNLSSASSGSHELLIGYCFKIEFPPRPPGQYMSPRFLDL